MENRDRDKLSRSGPKDAGGVNRDISSGREQEENISDAEFGQKIEPSEDLEPGSRQSESVDSSGMKGSENDH